MPNESSFHLYKALDMKLSKVCVKLLLYPESLVLTSNGLNFVCYYQPLCLSPQHHQQLRWWSVAGVFLIVVISINLPVGGCCAVSLSPRCPIWEHSRILHLTAGHLFPFFFCENIFFCAPAEIFCDVGATSGMYMMRWPLVSFGPKGFKEFFWYSCTGLEKSLKGLQSPLPSTPTPPPSPHIFSPACVTNCWMDGMAFWYFCSWQFIESLWLYRFCSTSIDR